jgi:hypothetical protein
VYRLPVDRKRKLSDAQLQADKRAKTAAPVPVDVKTAIDTFIATLGASDTERCAQIAKSIKESQPTCPGF